MKTKFESLLNFILHTPYGVFTLLSSIVIIFRNYYKAEKNNSILIFVSYLLNIIILVILNFFQILILDKITIFLLETFLGLVIFLYIIQKVKHYRKRYLLSFLFTPVITLMFIFFIYNLIDLLTINALLKKNQIILENKEIIQIKEPITISIPLSKLQTDNLKILDNKVELNDLKKFVETSKLNTLKILEKRFDLIVDIASDDARVQAEMLRERNKLIMEWESCFDEERRKFKKTIFSKLHKYFNYTPKDMFGRNIIHAVTTQPQLSLQELQAAEEAAFEANYQQEQIAKSLVAKQEEACIAAQQYAIEHEKDIPEVAKEIHRAYLASQTAYDAHQATLLAAKNLNVVQIVHPSNFAREIGVVVDVSQDTYLLKSQAFRDAIINARYEKFIATLSPEESLVMEKIDNLKIHEIIEKEFLRTGNETLEADIILTQTVAQETLQQIRQVDEAKQMLHVRTQELQLAKQAVQAARDSGNKAIKIAIKIHNKARTKQADIKSKTSTGQKSQATSDVKQKYDIEKEAREAQQGLDLALTLEKKALDTLKMRETNLSEANVAVKTATKVLETTTSQTAVKTAINMQATMYQLRRGAESKKNFNELNKIISESQEIYKKTDADLVEEMTALEENLTEVIKLRSAGYPGWTDLDTKAAVAHDIQSLLRDKGFLNDVKFCQDTLDLSIKKAHALHKLAEEKSKIRINDGPFRYAESVERLSCPKTVVKDAILSKIALVEAKLKLKNAQQFAVNAAITGNVEKVKASAAAVRLATEIVAETTILAKQTTQEALIKTAVAGVEMGAKESKGK